MTTAASAVWTLRTEADLLRTLDAGTYTQPELYGLAVDAGLNERPGGRRIIQDGQQQYKRRVRSVPQALKRTGRARPAGGASRLAPRAAGVAARRTPSLLSPGVRV